MKKLHIFQITLTLMLCPTSRIKADVSLFFAAHQDDWQLFMGVNAYGDMVATQSNAAELVVLFHMTAGDAGNNMSYVNAREACAMNSVRFATSSGIFLKPSGSGYVTVNGHNILYKTYGNVVSFFFRLPDGCFVPQGCTGNGSLEGLFSGAHTNVSAVDGSATYANWGDLVSTVSVMVGWYNQWNNWFFTGTKIWINHPDINTTLNPGDHPDHFYTGKLALQASAPYCPHYVAFVDYHSSSLTPNLTNNDIENEAALFGACTLGLIDGGWQSTWEPGHKSWLDRNYYRVWDASCDFMPDPWTHDDKLMLAGTITNDDTREEILGEGGQRVRPKEDEQVELYPQPTDDIFTVRFVSGDISRKVYKIEITDLLGKRILMSVENQNSIDVSDLVPGIYFSRIYTSPTSFTAKKFYKD